MLAHYIHSIYWKNYLILLFTTQIKAFGTILACYKSDVEYTLVLVLLRETSWNCLICSAVKGEMENQT